MKSIRILKRLASEGVPGRAEMTLFSVVLVVVMLLVSVLPAWADAGKMALVFKAIQYDRRGLPSYVSGFRVGVYDTTAKVWTYGTTPFEMTVPAGHYFTSYTDPPLKYMRTCHLMSGTINSWAETALPGDLRNFTSYWVGNCTGKWF